MLILPEKFKKVRLRQLADGSFMLARPDHYAVKWLDENAIRVNNELRWYEIPTVGKKIKDLKCIFEGLKCYIVGKGPSLDYLDESYFTNDYYPILAINESIHKIESLDLQNPIYCIQQDHSLGNTCKPKNADILLSIQASQNYIDIKNKYVYVPAEYKMTQSFLTVSLAIEIIKSLDSIGAILMCFDSCVNNNLEYADCIGYSSAKAGDVNRFLKHKNIILKGLDYLTYEWIIPKLK